MGQLARGNPTRTRRAESALAVRFCYPDWGGRNGGDTATASGNVARRRACIRPAVFSDGFYLEEIMR